MRLRLLVLFVASALFTGLGTTSASAVRYTYDDPTVARVALCASGDADSGMAQFTGMREWSASPRVEALGASTTQLTRNYATYNGGGVDRTFTHFTDEAGAVGITGTRPLAVGDSVGVGQLSFGKGQNNFLANAPGDNFVTDLPSTASPGQLNGIGVLGTKQQYAISFSEADAFTSGVRVQGTAQVSRGIYTIPGGCTIAGTCTVTRVR